MIASSLLEKMRIRSQIFITKTSLLEQAKYAGIKGVYINVPTGRLLEQAEHAGTKGSPLR